MKSATASETNNGGNVHSIIKIMYPGVALLFIIFIQIQKMFVVVANGYGAAAVASHKLLLFLIRFPGEMVGSRYHCRTCCTFRFSAGHALSVWLFELDQCISLFLSLERSNGLDPARGFDVHGSQ